MPSINRRAFSQGLLLASAASATTLSTGVQAQARAPREGADYLKLSKPAPVDSPTGKVEVVEFFWYACPHCNAFEPSFDAWAKRQPAHVVVKRVPVAFRDNFVPQQQLFYTLEAMGKVDELHKKVFYAIHVERQKLDTQATIVEWAVKQGLDRNTFSETYRSFGVTSKARKATQLQDAYQVDGVPSIGIAGRFFTSGSLAQTLDRSLQVADHLIEQARKG